MNKFFQPLALAAALVLAGCASTPKPGSPEAAAIQEQKKEKQEIKSVEKALSNIPDWFLNPPVAENAMYTAGVATSGDMQFAMDKAMLSAKAALASQLKNSVTARILDFMREAGISNDEEKSADAERFIQDVVTEVNLAGFRRDKSQVFQEGRTYRAYALLYYPIGDANKILRDQVKKSGRLEARLRASKAFQELEKEIEAARGR